MPKAALQAFPESLLATLAAGQTGAGDRHAGASITPAVTRGDGTAEYHLDRDPSLFPAVLNTFYQQGTGDFLKNCLQAGASEEDRWAAFRSELAFYNVGKPAYTRLFFNGGLLPKAACYKRAYDEQRRDALQAAGESICRQIFSLMAFPTSICQLLSNTGWPAGFINFWLELPGKEHTCSNITTNHGQCPHFVVHRGKAFEDYTNVYMPTRNVYMPKDLLSFLQSELKELGYTLKRDGVCGYWLTWN